MFLQSFRALVNEHNNDHDNGECYNNGNGGDINENV